MLRLIDPPPEEGKLWPEMTLRADFVREMEYLVQVYRLGDRIQLNVEVVGVTEDGPGVRVFCIRKKNKALGGSEEEHWVGRQENSGTVVSLRLDGFDVTTGFGASLVACSRGGPPGLRCIRQFVSQGDVCQNFNIAGLLFHFGAILIGPYQAGSKGGTLS